MSEKSSAAKDRHRVPMEDRVNWLRYIIYADPQRSLANDQARTLLERISELEAARDC